MPGVCHLSVDESLDREVDRVEALGIPAVILFGIPAAKDDVGTENFAEDGIVQRALRRLRDRKSDLLLVTDVCCCEYTSHGHCGVLRGDTVDNDATLEILGRVAVSHAAAGADIVAPSGMMDGMVGAIRAALDAAGHEDRAILSYAVKYASGFYGPFREAADSAPAFGDRRQYQMDPANLREGLLEAALDEAEGADMLMVKPALAYLDVVRAVRERTHLPLAGVQRQRRVRDGEGRGAARLGGRAPAGARGADRHAPRRRRRDHHLSREGGGGVAGGGGGSDDGGESAARRPRPRSGCSRPRSG